MVGGGCSFLRLVVGTPLGVDEVPSVALDWPLVGRAVVVVGIVVSTRVFPNSPAGMPPCEPVEMLDGATVVPKEVLVCIVLCCCCWFIIIMSILIMGSIGIVIPVSLSSVPLLASVVIMRTELPLPLLPEDGLSTGVSFAVGACEPLAGAAVVSLTRANSSSETSTLLVVSLMTFNVGELTVTDEDCCGCLDSVVPILGSRSMSMVASMGCWVVVGGRLPVPSVAPLVDDDCLPPIMTVVLVCFDAGAAVTFAGPWSPSPSVSPSSSSPSSSVDSDSAVVFPAAEFGAKLPSSVLAVESSDSSSESSDDSLDASVVALAVPAGASVVELVLSRPESGLLVVTLVVVVVVVLEEALVP